MDKSGNGIEHPMLNVAKILAEQKIENVRERVCVRLLTSSKSWDVYIGHVERPN